MDVLETEEEVYDLVFPFLDQLRRDILAEAQDIDQNVMTRRQVLDGYSEVVPRIHRQQGRMHKCHNHHASGNSRKAICPCPLVRFSRANTTDR